MISSVTRYILQLIIITLLFNIIFAKYESPSEHEHLSGLSNKRYVGSSYKHAGRNFKYAWFTKRDVHDEENIQSQQPSYRMNLLKDLFYRKYRDFI